MFRGWHGAANETVKKLSRAQRLHDSRGRHTLPPQEIVAHAPVGRVGFLFESLENNYGGSYSLNVEVTGTVERVKRTQMRSICVGG
jgi:hypothetical protein